MTKMGSTNLANKTNLRPKKVIVKLVAGMLVFKGAAYNTMPTSTLFMLNCCLFLCHVHFVRGFSQ